jgi:hypothetical protein
MAAISGITRSRADAYNYVYATLGGSDPAVISTAQANAVVDGLYAGQREGAGYAGGGTPYYRGKDSRVYLAYVTNQIGATNAALYMTYVGIDTAPTV